MRAFPDPVEIPGGRRGGGAACALARLKTQNGGARMGARRRPGPGPRRQKENGHIRVLKTGCWRARVLGWGVYL
jgi:hypothetical protein